MSLKEQDIVLTTVDVDGNKIIQLPVTRVENVERAPRTVNHKEPDENGNINIPSRHVGDEWHSFTGKIPTGGVPYNGQIVNRSAYPDLWAYAQEQKLVKSESDWQKVNSSKGGNVPYYSTGDGSTTFRMPKIEGYIKGAATTDTAGTYIAEGLPNIKGTFGRDDREAEVVSGAFAAINASGRDTTAEGGDGRCLAFDFDASRYNSIYGKSNHVTPETVHVLFGVYAFGEIVNTGTFDAVELANSVTLLESELAETVRTVNGNRPDTRGNVDVELPVGFVLPLAANSSPEGFLLCNGAPVSRSTYSDLFSKIGTTYGSGDGSTTFNLPDLTDKFIQGSGTAGTIKSAGLPNITGYHGGHAFKYGNYADVGGAFVGTSTRNGGAGEDGNISQVYVTEFDASRCSPIYGNSDTVQPPSVTMRYYIKY